MAHGEMWKAGKVTGGNADWGSRPSSYRTDILSQESVAT